MNCQEFRSNLDGLARGALTDARARDEAAAHGESCAACAACLADERALTAGLRALAATMREASAPARAEVALLSAFRSREASTPAAPTNVVPPSAHEDARQWSWVKTVAVAAMAAAAVTLFVLAPPSLLTPTPAGRAGSAANSPQAAPARTHNDSGADARQDGTASAAVEQGASPSGGAGPQGSRNKVEDVASRASATRRAVVQATNVSYGNTPRAAASGVRAATETADAREITTEFIPLVQDAGFAQSEGARLVRVELPRSALPSFGIPLNGEHAGGRVKADVLLGEDGTARAIRFVR